MSTVNPDLFNAFVELSKDDIILQKALSNNKSSEDFINSLLAAIICMVDRDRYAQKMIIDILKTNPEVQKLMKLKNDTSVLHQEKVTQL